MACGSTGIMWLRSRGVRWFARREGLEDAAAKALRQARAVLGASAGQL